MSRSRLLRWSQDALLLVVVRLGQVRHKTFNRHPVVADEIYRCVDESLRMVQQR